MCLFLSAKNVPSALSNGQGVGREKKTEMKQKEDTERESEVAVVLLWLRSSE